MSHDTRMPSIRLFVIGLVLGLFGACTGSEPETSVRYVFESSTPRGSTWFKGNTHAHTTNSDGDTPPSRGRGVVPRSRVRLLGALRPQRVH